MAQKQPNSLPIGPRPPAPKAPPKKDGPFDFVLYSTTGPGNVHQTVAWINERVPELIPTVVSVSFVSGHHSTVLCRGPSALFERLRAERRL